MTLKRRKYTQNKKKLRSYIVIVYVRILYVLTVFKIIGGSLDMILDELFS